MLKLAMACEVCKNSGVVFRDHCHVSGQFRGMLCNSCNIILSKHGDDPVSMGDRVQVLRLESELILSRGDDGSLYFRLQKSIAEQKLVRAEILIGLIEYIRK